LIWDAISSWRAFLSSASRSVRQLPRVDLKGLGLFLPTLLNRAFLCAHVILPRYGTIFLLTRSLHIALLSGSRLNLQKFGPGPTLCLEPNGAGLACEMNTGCPPPVGIRGMAALALPRAGAVS